MRETPREKKDFPFDNTNDEVFKRYDSENKIQ